jgi:hypothetical protein
MNRSKRVGLGRVTVSLRSCVAHLGTGPETVSSTRMPRLRASEMALSYRAKPG